MKRIVSLVFSLIMTTASYAALEARLDRSEMSVNDSFQLIISLTEKDSDAKVNLEPLKQDFMILGKSTSTQITLINSQQEQRTDLIFTLMPKHEGNLVVPSVMVGSNSTPSFKIKVITEAEETARDEKIKPVILTASIDKDSSYVQGQLIYTLKLFYSTRIDNGQLTRPSIDNALVKRLGDDRRSQTEYQGRLYQVLERQYAIYPQNSGELKIPPAIFTGMIEDLHSSTHTVGPFLQGFAKPLRLTSEAKSIKVKPIPSEWKGKHWLPAKNLVLKETWDLGKSALHVGDPITRTIELTVYGVSIAQLPELSFPEEPGVNIYPDRAQGTELLDDNQLVSRRVWRVSYIPTKAGDFNLPEISLPWWNIDKNQQELALVPAKQVSILPAQVNANAISTPIPSTQTAVKPSDPVSPIMTDSHSKAWIWAILFAGAWLLTLLLWWKSSRSPAAPKEESKPQTLTSKPKEYVQALKQACQDHQPHEAYRALLAWANAMWPESPIRNLGDIRERVQAGPFKESLLDLQECLYSKLEKNWDGDQFWQSFNNAQFITPVIINRAGEPLPPLFWND